MPRRATKIYFIEATVSEAPSMEFLDTVNREIYEAIFELTLKLNTKYEDQVRFNVGHQEEP